MTFSNYAYTMLTVDAIGSVLIFAALMTNKLDDFGTKYRAAMAIIGVGFLGQIVVLSQMLIIGAEQHTHATKIYWLIKDIGIVLWLSFAFYETQFKNICLRLCKKQEDLNEKRS